MESYLPIPRKYNNKVVIGLCVALAVAVGVIIYMYMRSDKESYTGQETQQHKAMNPRTQQQLPTKGAPTKHGLPTETRVDDDMPTLVFFWGSWCPHSTAMKPQWDKVASILQKDGAVTAMDFEQSNHKELIEDAQKHLKDFTGFPDVRFFPHGFGLNKPCAKYSGPRTEEGILAFAYGNLSGSFS